MLPLIALGLPALAFAPSESVHIGMEPVRVYKVHDDQQLRLRHGARQAFTGGEGQVDGPLDERTGCRCAPGAPASTSAPSTTATGRRRAARLPRPPALTG